MSGDPRDIWPYWPYQFPISPQSAFSGPGPSLRDYLAVLAFPAIYQHQTMLTDRAAELAYEQADEMLKAREVTNAASSEEGKP